MNKRMKTFYDQVGLDFENFQRVTVTKDDMEKFAELIVKECEKVAKGGSWYYDAPSCGWRAPINHVCNEMKQHFGVEE